MKLSIIQNRVPVILLFSYILYFFVLAIDPYDRSVWWAENIPIILIVVILVLSYKTFPFSNTAYIMMAFLIFLHTTGGYFTFERVPFDWVTRLFGFSRNHFDRIAHFSVGFYAYAVAELIFRKKWVSSRLILFLFPVFTIFAVASLYEIIEWLYAVFSSPEAGGAFLGSQGDIWDAQKDMLADGLGAIFATVFFFYVHRAEIKDRSQDDRVSSLP